MYPTEDWIIGRFKNVSKGTWKNPTNVREYLLYLEKNLHIKSPEDWNLVSKKQVSIKYHWLLLVEIARIFSLCVDFNSCKDDRIRSKGTP